MHRHGANRALYFFSHKIFLATEFGKQLLNGEIICNSDEEGQIKEAMEDSAPICGTWICGRKSDYAAFELTNQCTEKDHFKIVSVLKKKIKPQSVTMNKWDSSSSMPLLEETSFTCIHGQAFWLNKPHGHQNTSC